jgi:cytochrome o ubiquinol oxidase subunit IV
MSFQNDEPDTGELDTAPGDEEVRGGVFEGVRNHLIGLGLATLLTVTSFYISGTHLVWHPSIPVAIAVLAVAQMGVHLVFFLHITTGPESTNNVMALAFGVLIVFLIIGGSLWIMGHLDQNMMAMTRMNPALLG